MRTEEVLLLLLVGGYVLIGPALGVWAFARSGRLPSRIEDLESRFGLLQREIAALRSRLASDAGQAAADAGQAAAPAARPADGPTEGQGEPENGEAEPSAEQPSDPAAPGPLPRRDLEESLTSRWLVWLGAATLGIAGVFLVRYSMEQGWMGPAVRCLLGFALGGALAVGGEWLRRWPPQRAIAALQPDYVPSALSAAGLFIAFGSVYAAHALYDLLGPVTAFALLAAIAACGVALSVLQGPLIAIVGLLGGFVTPLAVASQEPSPWTLYAYLLVLSAGTLTVVRYMGWWRLAWIVLAGAGLWALLGIAAGSPDSLPAVALFLLLLAGLCLYLPRPSRRATAVVDLRTGFGPIETPERFAWGAMAVIAGLAFVLVRMQGYDVLSLTMVAVLSGLFLATGRREPAFDALPLLAALLVAAVFATWHLPGIVAARMPSFVIEGQGYGAAYRAPILPPELLPFATAAALFAALFAIGGFLALWGARRPALWAGVAGAMPVVLLAVAYWRFARFQVDLAWTIPALGLGGLALAAAVRVERYRDAAGMTGALAAFATAVVACVSLAATMALEQAWLTVALALQLPAIAWIEERLAVRGLRLVALVLAATVLVRLVLNVSILDYPLGEIPGLNWILYGYGIPAATFFLAARHFQRTADDLLVAVLEAGAIAFAVLLVTFQIRTLVEGALDSPDYGLLEASLQSAAWLAIAYGLLRGERQTARAVLSWGWRILLGCAAAQIVLAQLLILNPLWTPEVVGTLPILNVLALAYAMPAAFMAAIAPELRRLGYRRAGQAAGLFGVVLSFVYLTMEVRHAFQGPVLSADGATDAEWYSYSAVWLVLASGLLALGIRGNRSALRYASLVVVLLTVAKVFLLDISALTDLWRVASFLGLGLALVGIGWLYQRFVFRPRVT